MPRDNGEEELTPTATATTTQQQSFCSLSFTSLIICVTGQCCGCEGDTLLSNNVMGRKRGRTLYSLQSDTDMEATNEVFQRMLQSTVTNTSTINNECVFAPNATVQEHIVRKFVRLLTVILPSHSFLISFGDDDLTLIFQRHPKSNKDCRKLYKRTKTLFAKIQEPVLC